MTARLIAAPRRACPRFARRPCWTAFERTLSVECRMGGGEDLRTSGAYARGLVAAWHTGA